MVMSLSGESSRVSVSDFVGVTTVVVPPCQELLSSLMKLLRLPLFVSGGGGGSGTANPSLSIVCNLFKQSSDSNNAVISFVVVGVKVALSPSSIKDPKVFVF